VRQIVYEKLKKEIPKLVELCEQLPERYRDRCFETLMGSLVSAASPDPEDTKSKRKPKVSSAADSETETNPGNQPEPPAHRGDVLPAKARAVLRRISLTEEQLRTLVLLEDGEVHFLREPEQTTNAATQLTWALLVALSTMLKGGDLSFDPEDVRSICIDRGCYDKSNFSANFKKKKAEKLFLSVPEKQGDPVKLSPEGEKELGAQLSKMLQV